MVIEAEKSRVKSMEGEFTCVCLLSLPAYAFYRLQNQVDGIQGQLRRERQYVDVFLCFNLTIFTEFYVYAFTGSFGLIPHDPR